MTRCKCGAPAGWTIITPQHETCCCRACFEAAVRDAIKARQSMIFETIKEMREPLRVAGEREK